MEESQFSSELIPQSCFGMLPAGYTIRPLTKDFERGVLEVLGVLTTVGDTSKNVFHGIVFICTNISTI
jgi:hypothetical protein